MRYVISRSFQIMLIVVYFCFFYWVASMGLLAGLKYHNHQYVTELNHNEPNTYFYYALFCSITWIIFNVFKRLILRKLIFRKLIRTRKVLLILLLVVILFRVASINYTNKSIEGFIGDVYKTSYLTLNANNVYYLEESDRDALFDSKTQMAGFYFENDDNIIFLQLHPYPEMHMAKKSLGNHTCCDDYHPKGRFVYNLGCRKMYER